MIAGRIVVRLAGDFALVENDFSIDNRKQSYFCLFKTENFHLCFKCVQYISFIGSANVPR